MTKCSACGGTYAAMNPDGTRYFHACPPLSVVELAAKVLAGKVVLPAGESAADAVARRVYQRANQRDENVVASGDPKTPATIKSAGAGVTTVADPPPEQLSVVIVGL